MLPERSGDRWVGIHRRPRTPGRVVWVLAWLREPMRLPDWAAPVVVAGAATVLAVVLVWPVAAPRPTSGWLEPRDQPTGVCVGCLYTPDPADPAATYDPGYQAEHPSRGTDQRGSRSGQAPTRGSSTAGSAVPSPAVAPQPAAGTTRGAQGAPPPVPTPTCAPPLPPAPPGKGVGKSKSKPPKPKSAGGAAARRVPPSTR